MQVHPKVLRGVELAPYHRYYDVLYANKAYRDEAQTVLDIYRRVVGGSPDRILDVGCGSGNHAFHLAEEGTVVGVDRDEPAVAIAEDKAAGTSNPRFVAGSVGDVDEDSFDLGVALFHVVNYVLDLEDLVDLLTETRKRLADDGVLVFDCWNGAEALRDPPRREDREIDVPGGKLETSIRPQVDRLRGEVTIRNEVTARPVDGPTETFEFSYRHKLWTPWTLEEAVTEAGLEVTGVHPPFRPDEPAPNDSWKLMFIARKR